MWWAMFLSFPPPPLLHHGHAQLCALTRFLLTTCHKKTRSAGRAEVRWLLNGPVMNHCCRCWIGVLFGSLSVKVIFRPIRCRLFWCRWRLSGRTQLWPLNVPAEVRHLNIAPDHESAGQVEAVLGVGSDELVLLTEGVTEHLIQSGGHIDRRQFGQFHIVLPEKHLTGLLSR